MSTSTVTTMETATGSAQLVITIERIETPADEVRFTKAQMRPMRGWPDGVDPYPGVPDEAVVTVARYPNPRKCAGVWEGNQWSHMLFGTKFYDKGTCWRVTSSQSEALGGGRWRGKFKAVEVLFPSTPG